MYEKGLYTRQRDIINRIKKFQSPLNYHFRSQGKRFQKFMQEALTPEERKELMGLIRRSGVTRPLRPLRPVRAVRPLSPARGGGSFLGN